MTGRLAILAALLLAGCTNQNSDYDTLSALLAPAGQPVPARVQALIDGGAAQLQVGFPQAGRSGTLLLENRRDGIDTWISVDGATLITDQGMIRGTRGFGAGLMAADIAQSRSLILSGQGGFALRFHSYLTGNDETATRSYKCRIGNRGARQVDLAEGPVATRLMAEECRGLSVEFSNLYWVSDTTGRIVQSRQWTGPFLGPVSTRAMRD